MNILYIITILAVYTLFMMIHKTEKKQNAVAWLAISAILVLCYNTFICLICTFIDVLCTLQNLSICNSILIIIFSIILLKSKKIQKYYVKISDIVFSILILIIVIAIAYKQYGFPFKIKYQITDGSTHYFYAEEFYRSSTLLYKVEANNIFGLYDSDFRLPGAYVNEGILFKVFDDVIAHTDLFILFDLCILYLSGILFYYLLKTYAKEDKKMQILAGIFSIMYMLGYQLNSMIYGFIYLSLALDIIIAFLLIMANYEKKEISNMSLLAILSMLSFGIFFSYAYFIPVIYIAFIANIIIKRITKKEKILSEDNLIKVWLVIILPLILGLTFFIILPASTGIKNEISTITIDGTIYKNYITNLLIFIPIFLAQIILAIKNKKKENNFSIILFILSILFAVILFIGNKLNIVSEYYFFKAYYIIFPLAIQCAYIALCNILENGHKNLKIATYIYISIFVIAITLATVATKNIGINDIWNDNIERILDKLHILSSEELKILQKYETLEKKEVYILGTKYQGKLNWMTVLYDKSKIWVDVIHNQTLSIEKWIEEKAYKYYVAYYEDYKMIKEEEANLDKNSNEYKIIYINDYGFILERTDITQ